MTLPPYYGIFHISYWETKEKEQMRSKKTRHADHPAPRKNKKSLFS